MKLIEIQSNDIVQKFSFSGHYTLLDNDEKEPNQHEHGIVRFYPFMRSLR